MSAEPCKISNTEKYRTERLSIRAGVTQIKFVNIPNINSSSKL